MSVYLYLLCKECNENEYIGKQQYPEDLSDHREFLIKHYDCGKIVVYDDASEDETELDKDEIDGIIGG